MADDPAEHSEQDLAVKLLFIRHPQTVYNLAGRQQGQSDSPLSTLGEQQCEQAIAGLAAWHPDAIVASPLGRCQSIARPLAAATGLTLELDARLQEMSFGKLEGLDHAEAHALGYAFPWDVGYVDQPNTGIEGANQFVARVMAAAGDLAQRQGRLAVITHGGVIRCIMANWLGIARQYIWVLTVRNTESTCFSVDNCGTIYLEACGLKPQWLSTLG